MFIPYSVDVPFNHRPVMNWLITVALVLIFAAQISAVLGQLDHGLSLYDAIRNAWADLS